MNDLNAPGPPGEKPPSAAATRCSTPPVSEVRFIAASSQDADRGLLGYVSCVVDDCLCLNGITVRRTAAGNLTLSFPERRTKRGEVFPYMRPVSAVARADIERAILGAIGLEGAP